MIENQKISDDEEINMSEEEDDKKEKKAKKAKGQKP